MAKVRAPKEAKNSKSHLRARLEYLQQAANFLQNAHLQRTTAADLSTKYCNAAMNHEATEQVAPQITSEREDVKSASNPTSQHSIQKPLTNISRVYVSQMRGVSLKTQTRLAIPVKRSFCKRCDASLIPGANCIQEIRNDSRGQKKPWADVKVVRCLACGTEKRFPQTEKRSKKLPERRHLSKQQESVDDS
ncbi:hypothetical protein N7462_001040 [Penicillium macrosclerotiorum]|uniref:uncharacterized protein n=1 Tax=Penicillium macrosclerotiorum TaxID=303699 RepID=UPI0025498095|nr:uncharacterized protein N7462_001040 [Penicillium macrosclerotiorum]KAJ5699035.1 hypothetical protein N7462_001040 [Penicillium macrosclerotiorum]